MKHLFFTLLIGIFTLSCNDKTNEKPIIKPAIERQDVSLENLLVDYVKLNNPKKVDSIWNNILASNKKTANTLIIYANYINRNKTMNNEAIDLYKEAIAVEPNNYMAYKTLGNLYIHYNMLNDALIYLNSAYKLNSNDHELATNIGNIYFVNKNYKTAITYYTQAIQLKPNEENGYFNRSLCYQNMGMNQLAEIDYLKAESLRTN